MSNQSFQPWVTESRENRLHASQWLLAKQLWNLKQTLYSTSAFSAPLTCHAQIQQVAQSRSVSGHKISLQTSGSSTQWPPNHLSSPSNYTELRTSPLCDCSSHNNMTHAGWSVLKKRLPVIHLYTASEQHLNSDAVCTLAQSTLPLRKFSNCLSMSASVCAGSPATRFGRLEKGLACDLSELFF